MTTREVAAAVGKPEKTVRTWASKASAKTAVAAAKLAEGTPAKPADWDIDETCAIIEIGLGKNAADLFRMNARQKDAEPRQNVPPVDYAAIVAPIVAETIKQLLPYMQGVALPARIAPAQLGAPATVPPLSPRKELNMLAHEAGVIMGDYREPWNQIYKNAYYRLGINIRERAKNRNMEPLNYAEEEGYIVQLVEIAREIFK